MKNIFFIIIFLFLNSCGFTPIYSSKDSNYKIMSFQKNINNNLTNYIQDSVTMLSNDNAKNVLKIDLNFSENIIVILKDSKGDPLKFEMIAYVEYKLIHNDISLIKKKVKKNSIYNNDSDQFELEQSEKIILKNLSESISDIIISSIINLDDN